jgi:hypothetical protein
MMGVCVRIWSRADGDDGDGDGDRDGDGTGFSTGPKLPPESPAISDRKLESWKYLGAFEVAPKFSTDFRLSRR